MVHLFCKHPWLLETIQAAEAGENEMAGEGWPQDKSCALRLEGVESLCVSVWSLLACEVPDVAAGLHIAGYGAGSQAGAPNPMVLAAANEAATVQAETKPAAGYPLLNHLGTQLSKIVKTAPSVPVLAVLNLA